MLCASYALRITSLHCYRLLWKHYCLSVTTCAVTKPPWKPMVKVQTIIGGYARVIEIASYGTEIKTREWQHLSRDSNAQLWKQRVENGNTRVKTTTHNYRSLATPEQRQQHIATEAESNTRAKTTTHNYRREWQHQSKDSNT